ncbi:MAG: DUF1571 domain-containing protein [Planctomycetota bacterium]|nr:DUF1571 domain-containing protein [Planctomycetota bacterium]
MTLLQTTGGAWRRMAVVSLGIAAACLAWAAMTSAAPAPALSEGAKSAVYPNSPEDMKKLAAGDPLEFLRKSLKWTDERVGDYTCQFQKQEKIDGEIQKAETMQMKFRARTFSLYIKWVGDNSAGQEALYVEGKNDGKVAAHPSGLLGILVRKVMIDPTSKLALKHARRPLTFAGMANMLRLVIPQCEKAKANGDLTLTFEGLRDLNGRPTYVFKRVLPNKNDYACPILTIYIDQQFLICVRTDAYDWDGTLMSQYIYSDILINPGLKDEDFDVDNKQYGFRVF